VGDALVELRGLTKRYPGVLALDRVDLDVRAGEVHALAGQNGAGKSTLARILGGVERPDAGSIAISGAPRSFATSFDALRAGVAVVHQEAHLVPQLSLVENFFLGRERRRRLLGLPAGLDWRAMRERTRARLDELSAGPSLDLDVDARAATLSTASAQLVAIARALDLGSRVLVLDEPTSSLDAAEVERLFERLRALRGRGWAIVLVAHSLDQIYALSDRITVLRDGKREGTFETSELPRERLIAAMLGRELAAGSSPRASPPADGDVVLSAHGLGRRRSIAPFDLDLRSGEVVGLAGLLGSGRSELARLLAGVDRATSGTVSIDGEPARRRSPRAAIARGVAYTPEDRKLDGLFPSLSVAENVAIVVQRKLSRFGRLSPREHRRLAERFVASLGIVPADVGRPIGTLSGGNQQKALLARALAAEPRVLVLDEPTRGVDVGAKREIERLVRELAASGIAVVLVSSALDELVRAAHRVLVLHDRRVVAEIAPPELDEPRIREALGGGRARA
jgi:galactofuranose transport system ATP-binding protein